ncbi:MAG: hypothetical protein KGM42_00875 [Hyphomicrobiales bacterium]|nr:hypothetical protein [Hyphomicrobiales bacterium]
MPANSIASCGSALRRRVAQWLRSKAFVAEFSAMDPATRAGVLSELNVSEGALSAMAASSLTSEGLERVLGLLELDKERFERELPVAMADLHRTCSMCKDWIKCGADLDAGRFSREVEAYCPNQEVLRQLLSQKQRETRAGSGA